MITKIEDYFRKGCGRCDRFDTAACATRLWADGLAELRRICRSAELEETVKWGHPCYTHAERNIALIGALHSDFRLNFFNAALLNDPDGILEKQGPNTQHADSLRFRSKNDVLVQEATVRTYLAEAKGYAEAGIRPDRTQAELDLPAELLDALDQDSELAEAFRGLTPGRRRSYVINLNGAKAAATRRSRIERFRPAILAGKGANER